MDRGVRSRTIANWQRVLPCRPAPQRGTLRSTLLRPTQAARRLSFGVSATRVRPVRCLGPRPLRETWPGVEETGTIENVVTVTLDEIAVQSGFSKPDLLVVDVQGAELLVLKGGLSVLAAAKAVIVEVSRKPYYEGGVLYPELRDFLWPTASRGASRARSRRPALSAKELIVLRSWVVSGTISIILRLPPDSGCRVIVPGRQLRGRHRNQDQAARKEHLR